jgi:hypothetical protein
MTIAIFDIQKAVFSKLNNDASLTSLLGSSSSIFENPRLIENPAFPYIALSSLSTQRFDTKNTDGTEAYITLNIFSSDGTKQNVSAIMDRVHTLLHRKNLTLDTNNFLLCSWDGLADIFIDDSNDSIITQGVIRFKIISTKG